MAALPAPSPATVAIHGDDSLASAPVAPVAPPIHVSTTFHYPRDPAQLVTAAEHWEAFQNPPDGKPAEFPYVYSRLTTPSTTRLEQILSSLLDGHAITYSSGLAGFHALLVRLNPKRLVIGDCYHGCHEIARIFSRLTGMESVPLDAATEMRPGDLVHLETPLNPHGTATSIAECARRAHAAGAVLSVDGTFAPPPLQNPFAHGADYVMHSVTKYIGGHSDMLGGVLVTKDLLEAAVLRGERMYMGSVMGGLEGWLGLRSVRTLELRVLRQSDNATRLVAWLHALAKADPAIGGVVKAVMHASLQPQEPWLKEQMPNGFGPVFAIHTRTSEQAKTLPSRLMYFHHATSLGGVESLIEWRAMTDHTVEHTVVRVSVGCEGWEDLRNDLERGLREVAALGL